jgi:hypothetical protein
MANHKRTKTSGQGRPKGSKNKLTVEAKEAFRLAAEGMGGVAALTAWGKEAPDKFWPLYAKLIPMDVTSGGKAIAPSAIRIELVSPDE